MQRSFGAFSTADEVLEGIDLRGVRALVTGVSAGLGIEIARVLVSKGASVIGTARDIEKARASTKPVMAEIGSAGSFELAALDLASLRNVYACADALIGQEKPLDLVIANAGVMATPFGKTADGFETQFGTNHLGHFALINRIAPLLNTGARVIVVSSSAHRESDVVLDDPNFEKTTYTPLGAYARSKTANVLFATEFDRRNKARGIRSAAVHPGLIQTELGRYLTPETVAEMRGSGISQITLKSIQQGAATTIWAAIVAPAEMIGGKFCEDCSVASSGDTDMMRGVSDYALDPHNAQALWAKSEEMIGEAFA